MKEQQNIPSDLTADERRLYAHLQEQCDLAADFNKQIADINVKLDQCERYAKELGESLRLSRKARLERKTQVNQSLSKCIDLWRAEEERKQLLIIAEEREAKRRNTFRFKFCEYIGQFLGISKKQLN